MSAPTVHLKGYDLDPAVPLDQQATSLAAELEACGVFQAAAERDLDGGDLRAIARLAALAEHEEQLRARLIKLRLAERRD